MNLNEKLAKWAGFTRYISGERTTLESGWASPDRIVYYHAPDFTDSLDLCFRYLVPKCVGVRLDWEKAETWAEVDIPDRYEQGEFAPTPALALCKAIEKLIDAEGK